MSGKVSRRSKQRTKLKERIGKISLRLRHWLIKKLGGYTEQTVMPPIRYPPLPSTLLNPERVIAHMRIDTGDLVRYADDEEIERVWAHHIRQDLTDRIVQEIINRDYGVLTCNPDIEGWPGQRVYSLAVCIVPPSEWMKTGFGDIMDARRWEGTTL